MQETEAERTVAFQRLADHRLDASYALATASYSIRSVPPNANDRFLTDRFARNAVHAAMAGKTDVMVGGWNQATIWVPIATAVAERKRMDPDGDIWNAVLATTGQPNWRPPEDDVAPAVAAGRHTWAMPSV